MGDYVSNPIHRDDGRRDQGEQPYEDARETYSEKEASIEKNAPFPDMKEQGLSEDERRTLEEQAAENRLEDIGREVSEQRDAGKGDDHGN